MNARGFRDVGSVRLAGSKDRRPTPCRASILGGFTPWDLRVLTSGILRRNRQDSVPIRKRTSDNGVFVRGNGGLMCTVRSLHAAGFLTGCGPAVVPAAPQRACRTWTGATPPKFGPGSGAGPPRMCTRRPAPFEGSLPSNPSLAGKRASRPSAHRRVVVAAPRRGVWHPEAACRTLQARQNRHASKIVLPNPPLPSRIDLTGDSLVSWVAALTIGGLQ